MRAIIAWALVLAAAGCRDATMRGPLAALADSVGAGPGRGQCTPTFQPPYGRATGCAAVKGDTAAYVVVASSGRAVLVGREWPVPGSALESTFVAPERVLEARFGPGEACEHPRVDWEVFDRRWQAGEYHVALLALRPV